MNAGTLGFSAQESNSEALAPRHIWQRSIRWWTRFLIGGGRRDWLACISGSALEIVVSVLTVGSAPRCFYNRLRVVQP